jgi:hypothetical protein
MRFKEYYTLLEEAKKDTHLEFLIRIKLYQPALDKIKAKPGYTSMVKPEKENIFYAAANALNNYPFNGKGGAFSDGRMKVQADTSEFEREDLPYIDIYVSGVDITSDVEILLYKHLHTYRPHLVGSLEVKNLFKGKLTPQTKETFGDLIDEL